MDGLSAGKTVPLIAAKTKIREILSDLQRNPREEKKKGAPKAPL